MSHAAKALRQLDDDAYAAFRDLVVQRTGMLFGERRREALARAVGEQAQHTTGDDLGAYHARLAASPTDSRLWDDLIQTLTVNETYFFRDPEQIEALRRHILPDLIARHWEDRTLRLWSAGCSTGEEPYTLAILLRQIVPDIAQWKILILATDLNKQALQTASRARYRPWSFRQTDSAVRRAYFTPEGDSFVLSPSLQRMVTFAYLNLAENSYPTAANNTTAIDLILCRNVTIYLPPPVIREVAGRFHQCLAPGGWLVVGPSETNEAYYHPFHVLKFTGAIVYQKVAGSHRPAAVGGLLASPEPAAMAPLPTRPSQKPAPAGQPSPQPATPSKARPQLWQPLTPVRPPPAESQAALPTPAQLLERGCFLAHERRYAEARQCFTDVLKRTPDEVAALYHLARLEANAGRLAEAKQWAQRTLEKDPLHCEAHFTLAQIHQELGEPDQAVARYKKALYLDPGFVLAHFSLSNLYHQAGRTAEAARHRALSLRLAAKLPPDELLLGSDDLTAGQLISAAQGTA